MDDISGIAFLLLLANCLISYKGFRNEQFMEKYIFHVDRILIDKEYIRLLSSGFLHGGLWHFLFNMIALTSFCEVVEITLGPLQALLIYFASLFGGNLLALFVHRNHGDYRALGASGAVSGIVFASILLFPQGDIRLILIPIDFKAWLIGIVFILYSIFGIKYNRDNIGHEAHLGGAIIGMLMVLLLRPELLSLHSKTVALLLIPSLLFLILIIRNPNVLILENYWGDRFDNLKQGVRKSRKSKENLNKEEELNALLEKIKSKGYKSLSEKEKDRLKKLSEG